MLRGEPLCRLGGRSRLARPKTSAHRKSLGAASLAAADVVLRPSDRGAAVDRHRFLSVSVRVRTHFDTVCLGSDSLAARLRFAGRRPKRGEDISIAESLRGEA